jgi:hypothetical protein
MAIMRAFAATTAAALVMLAGSVATAQWLTLKLPETPRLADGRPNLAAPTPRAADGKSDLSGIWQRVRPPAPDAFRGFTGLEVFQPPGFVFPYTPWAEAIFKERQAKMGGGRPSERCLPHGVPDAMLPETPFKIVQHPRLTLILYEEFARFRQVFLDGRGHPVDPNPAWLGYSIGRWDGDAFEIDTRGYNDLTWLDDAGRPHSEQMRTTERFTRRDFGHLEMRLTIEDAKAYTRPWSVTIPFVLLPDTELIESVCDNERYADKPKAQP